MKSTLSLSVLLSSSSFFFSPLSPLFLSPSLPLLLGERGDNEGGGGGRNGELASTIVVETKDCLYYFS